jgi:hypothetical protein
MACQLNQSHGRKVRNVLRSGSGKLCNMFFNKDLAFFNHANMTGISMAKSIFSDCEHTLH